MTGVADIPAETALLCEACGYTLHVVEPAGNCPECGTPISQSLPHLREAPAWEERRGIGGVTAWLGTSVHALFQPGVFFRRLALPGDIRRSRYFRWTHHTIAAILLGLSGWIHADRFGLFIWQLTGIGDGGFAMAATAMTFVLVSYLLLSGITRLVARLSAWEAGYRGLRLPRPVVDRAMDYHAVHLLPPSMTGFVITAGYAILERRHATLAGEWAMIYLYVLAGAVIVAAAYLFITYWAAMRNLMYANRQDTWHSVLSNQP